MEHNEIRIAPEQSGKGPALAKAHTRLRGLLALALCFCLTLGALPTPAAAAGEAPTDSWTDEGNYDTSWYTEHRDDSEYTLTTAAQLAGLAYLVNGRTSSFGSKIIHLGNDIDLSAHLWTPIAPGSGREFDGEFDGNGKTIRGLTISAYGAYNGLFGYINSPSATIHDLQIQNASVSIGGNEPIVGILVGASVGSIYNCAVSGSVRSANLNGCGGSVYVGGLAGRNSGTIKNCSAWISSMVLENYTDSPITFSDAGGGIFGNGSGIAENCFALVENFDNSKVSSKTAYTIGPTASYSYWDNSATVTASGNATYTQCYPLTLEQIAGTGGAAIDGGSTYANTPSLAAALNNWVAANNTDSKYSEWSLANGKPMLSVFPAPPAPPLPDYIDITTVPDQTKEGTAGQVNADVKLEGQVQENVELISVTLPASIPFIMDVDAAGALQRVLSATATLTNRSDVGVTVTLTDVVDNDPTPLLDKADFVLVPDPDPTGNPVTLTAGTGKTDVLAILAAPADGVPTTSLLKVDGAARADVDSVGSDGDSFTIGLTLKVNKTT